MAPSPSLGWALLFLAARRRWIIERTISWLLSFRRLTVRYERCLELYHAFVILACIVITLRRF